MKNYKIIIFVLLLLIVVPTGFFLAKSYISPKNFDSLKAEIKELETENALMEEDISLMKEQNEQFKDEKKELLHQLEELDKERIAQLTKATGLVNVQEIDDSLVLDLRYATENNFVGKKVYSVAVCLLQDDTALKLKHANELAKKDGYRIKIWDGYRPMDVQKIFWESVPDPRYVSDPSKGSDHNQGTAVDVTLIDQAGNELEMPTGFDDFSEKAWRNYQGNSEDAQKNMEYLTKIMQQSGFSTIRTEWWHFKDNNDKNYPFQNIPLEYFMPKTF